MYEKMGDRQIVLYPSTFRTGTFIFFHGIHFLSVGRRGEERAGATLSLRCIELCRNVEAGEVWAPEKRKHHLFPIQ